jgi:hypothetical protein
LNLYWEITVVSILFLLFNSALQICKREEKPWTSRPQALVVKGKRSLGLLDPTG